jgi:hypothetical protein
MTIDKMAYEGDIVSRLRHWRGLHLAHGGELFEEAAAEIASLREAIRRLAEQAATLSVQGGNVTVTMDATLTDAEREAVEWYANFPDGIHAATLRKLLERNDHDAVPEAIANAESVAPQPTAGDRSGNPTSHSGTGNTQKPVAWARFFPNGGPMSVFLDRPPADSEPLYRHPLCQDSLQKNLTEAEHDALEFAVETGRVAMHDEATLRKLLERLHT